MSRRPNIMEEKRERIPKSSANGSYPKPAILTDLKRLATTSLNTLSPRPVRWTVEGYIPSGKLTILAGDGGHGKTTVTLHLTACLSTGLCCFGLKYAPPPPSDVLLISCEDDFEDTVVPRLLAAGADLSRVHRVDGVPTADGKPAPFSLLHYQQLEHELEKRPAVRLVVIDPAGAYVGRSGVDDHKDSELRALLGPLAELAARQNVAVILVKHLNKGATAKAVHKVGGSAGYVNTVRAAWVVAPHPNDEENKLFLPLKFNICKKPAGLSFRLVALPEGDCSAIVGRFADLNDEDRARLAAQLFRPEWGENADIDADEALGEATQNGRSGTSKVEQAAEWVKGFLAEFAYPSSEVFVAGEESGFTQKLLYAAKRVAGVQCSNRGAFRGVWYWGIGNPSNWTPRPPENSPHPTNTEKSAKSAKSGENPRVSGSEEGQSFQTSQTRQTFPNGDEVADPDGVAEQVAIIEHGGG